MTGQRITLAVLGAALLAIAVLVMGDLGAEETAEPAPMVLGEPGMPLAEREPPARELPEGFVPDLPPVPTLPAGTHLSHEREAAPTGDDERVDALSAEMRLLSEARVELGNDDAASALTLLEQHRERFPDGALAEEREAYTILALHAVGREPEVERRYVDFRRDYPDSTFTERLTEALSHP